jgi:hypothetical protein
MSVPSEGRKSRTLLLFRTSGVSKTQSSRWQKLAALDDESFERHVVTAKKRAVASTDSTQNAELKQEMRADRERDLAAKQTALPKSKQQSSQLQAAGEAVIMAAEDLGPLMHARIGVLRALNRNVERVFDSSRKETHWGKRKLKRDQ